LGGEIHCEGRKSFGEGVEHGPDDQSLTDAHISDYECVAFRKYQVLDHIVEPDLKPVTQHKLCTK
jgi:hypothetical protein